MTFDEAVGDALQRVRGGTSPHDAIAAVLGQLEEAAVAEGAKAGLYARVFETLNRERDTRDRVAAQRRAHELAARAGTPSECPWDDCSGGITRIERYHATIVWSKREDGSWDCRELGGRGTHYHLFCDLGCETKAWPNAGRHEYYVLPPELLEVVEA